LARKKKTEVAAIDGWRDRIDAIDDRLLVLLNQRAECSIEIGWIKRAHDLEIYVPAREVQILGRMSRANRGPLREESIRRLFERIIDESRATERVVCSEPGLDEKNGPGEPGAKEPVASRKRVSRRGNGRVARNTRGRSKK
jgi:chorismate mutase